MPGAAGVVVGDLSSLAETKAMAVGAYDVVVHNAGVQERDRVVTVDGLERTFQVNVLAPYVLTCLLPRPSRLVYLTSGLEADGEVHLDDLQTERRPFRGMQAYADSKALDVVLALAVACRWPDVAVNAVDPGWVRTRMGGGGAPDSLADGAETQVWLATSDEPAALESGRYLKHRRSLRPNVAATDVDVQEGLLAALERLTGVALPD